MAKLPGNNPQNAFAQPASGPATPSVPTKAPGLGGKPDSAPGPNQTGIAAKPLGQSEMDVGSSRPGAQTGKRQAPGSNAGGSRDLAGRGHMQDWADREHPVGKR